MSLYDFAHSQNNSYCDIMLTSLQHALIQTTVNYINHIEKLSLIIFFKHSESMKLFFNHYILDVIDHQNSSHDYNLIALEILCQ